ncbi:hypothetical protein BDY24DRAFT_427087 [Mrakia frigida]|uniref:DUF6534 domain-containing protein n=1 Tax=Mrakia frigida TaxID=29902 RepID=UPI003FCC0F97
MPPPLFPSPQQPQIPESVDLPGILGPYFFGVCLECFGMGIVLLQSLRYFIDSSSGSSKARHPIYLCVGVGLLLVLNLAQTMLDVARVNASSSRGQGEPSMRQSWEWRLLWRRSAVSSLGTLCCILGAWLGWEGNRKSRGCQFNYSNRVWLAASSAIDIVLALVFTLQLRSSRSEFSQTNDILTRLSMIVLGSGLLTACIQLSTMLLQLLSTHTAASGSWPYLLILPLSKIYTIGLLVSLNSGAGPSKRYSYPLAMASTGLVWEGGDPNRGRSRSKSFGSWRSGEKREKRLERRATYDSDATALPMMDYSQREYRPSSPSSSSMNYVVPPPVPAAFAANPVLQLEVYRRPVTSSLQAR